MESLIRKRQEANWGEWARGLLAKGGPVASSERIRVIGRCLAESPVYGQCLLEEHPGLHLGLDGGAMRAWG